VTRPRQAPAATPPLDDDRHPDDRLERTLSLTDTTLLAVSSVIGVGIFLTPGVVAASLPVPSLFLFAWALGGLLSLAGALANAELGAMYPHAGGDYVYLREAYHPTAGFLVGWLSFFVIYAGTVATLAMGFAEGLAHYVSLGAAGKIVVAVAITIVTSWINYLGVRPGALLNNLSAALKVATLAGLGVVGWFFVPSVPAELTATAVESFPAGRRSPASGSRCRRSCSATSAGTRRCTSRARSATRSATCRCRSSSASASAPCSTCC